MNMKLFRSNVSVLIAMVAAFVLAGCARVEEPDYRDQDYGYVQFKLYKEASYPDTKAAQLNYLKDVAKIKVTLRYEGNKMAQTLVMTASDDAAAEFGLRSDKLKLLSGDYQVSMFTLYNKVDEPVYESTPTDEFNSFTVVAGGLTVHDLVADVVERGKVKFSIVKDISGLKDLPQTKAANREYTFDEIKYLTVSVATGKTETVFEMLPAEFSVHFSDNGDDTDGYQTSSCVCDSLLTLRAGEYKVVSYSVFDTSKRLLETNKEVDAKFVVADNRTTEAGIPVQLHESDEYLKDYYALYEIWKSLNGPEWYYIGEGYPQGANWDFNKDPDLWGDQPGVSLHSNGRVALLNLSDFGFYGDLSPAIGQLTQLVELYFGNHNDGNLISYDPTVQPGKGTARRMERHKEYMASTRTLTQVSEPIARALAENGISIPEMALYEKMNEDDIIEKGSGKMRIQPKDMIHGKINNGLKSLPKEIGNLTKLEQLFIANSEIETLPDEIANLVSCTDVEIYNCPKMKEFPMAVTRMPELALLNLANNRQWSAEEILKGFKGLATGPSREKLQIIYLNENNLEVVPKEIKNMKKLGMIEFSSNRIHTIEEAWGSDIKPVQIFFDNNRLSEFPVDEKGVFCYMEDAETFSVRNNNFTQFPNIFDAESLFAIVSIDFSYNHISSFPEDFRGVYVQTLTIANNPEFTKYPIELAKSNSKVMNINFRGCNINEIPEGSFDYENAINLTSFDFSYNDLKELPWEMHAGNMPYLYGVELSYNHFSSFPWGPLDSQYLTVFAIRGQRDENGARCLSEWPTGIYQHRGLRGFYIGSNNLGKIDDTISTICYYLDISDNPEIVFDASDICYAIQQGAYILIYDKTQEIRNCDILF
jgi:Leucine-rich repeat (LRR) protein